MQRERSFGNVQHPLCLHRQHNSPVGAMLVRGSSFLGFIRCFGSSASNTFTNSESKSSPRIYRCFSESLRDCWLERTHATKIPLAGAFPIASRTVRHLTVVLRARTQTQARQALFERCLQHFYFRKIHLQPNLELQFPFASNPRPFYFEVEVAEPKAGKC